MCHARQIGIRLTKMTTIFSNQRESRNDWDYPKHKQQFWRIVCSCWSQAVHWFIPRAAWVRYKMMESCIWHCQKHSPNCTSRPPSSELIPSVDHFGAKMKISLKILFYRDLTQTLKPLQSIFNFENSSELKYGQLVLPYLPANFGPMYFCKLTRNGGENWDPDVDVEWIVLFDLHQLYICHDRIVEIKMEKSSAHRPSI